MDYENLQPLNMNNLQLIITDSIPPNRASYYASNLVHPPHEAYYEQMILILNLSN